MCRRCPRLRMTRWSDLFILLRSESPGQNSRDIVSEMEPKGTQKSTKCDKRVQQILKKKGPVKKCIKVIENTKMHALQTWSFDALARTGAWFSLYLLWSKRSPKWYPKVFKIDASRCHWDKKGVRRHILKTCKKQSANKHQHMWQMCSKWGPPKVIFFDVFVPLGHKASQGGPMSLPGTLPEQFWVSLSTFPGLFSLSWGDCTLLGPVLYCNILYYTILYYTILYYAMIYDTILG